MSEIWKDIEGYDGRYQVSNLGRVRSVDFTVIDKNGRQWHHKGQIMKIQISTSGYPQVMAFGYPHIAIHRAVAMAFVPGYFNGAQVNHIDENKQNNRWNNLEWVTPKENVNHGSRNKRSRETKEKLYGCPVEQYTIDGKLITSYPSQNEAARAIGVLQGAIYRVIKNNRPLKGYLFKRKTN